MVLKILNKNIKIFLIALAILLAGGGLAMFKYHIHSNNFLLSKAQAEPYSYNQRGQYPVEYETYDLAGSYIQVPSKGTKEQSQSFGGYDVYEYFYPSNPEKNTDKRKKLYAFNKDGSVETYGNSVVKGDRTQLYNEYNSGSMGIGSYDTSAGERTNQRQYLSLTPRSSDVNMNGSVDINNNWDPNNNSGLGPSVFFNPNSSKLEMEKTYYLSDAKKDSVIETSLIGEEAEYFWQEYLSTGEDVGQLQDATAFAYKEPYFYIADMGNRRLVRYNPSTDEFTSLGKGDWNWIIRGITVDDEGYMYVTDTAIDSIIKTKITGEGWEESYKDIDDYQSRLFLDGSERYKTFGHETGSSLAKNVSVNDCGYTSHKVMATSSTGFTDVDPVNGRPLMMSTDGCAFGDDCFAFNGHERLDLPDDAAWNFGDDFFTIDLWVQFSTLDKTVAIISHPGSFLVEWQPSDPSIVDATSTLNFAFMNQDRGADNNYTYQTFREAWAPEEGEWYHLAIVRNEDNELEMIVDGELLGDPTPITGKLLDGQSIFQVGGYYQEKAFQGKMDNVRVARGRTQWVVDYSYRYQFNNPRGIVLAQKPDDEEEFLYIVDSGNGRIVKMSTDFRRWWTFGSEGSGEFQFKQPTDIYYFEGYFYITDTGNHRVIKTDMTQMVYYLKGESGGSWEEIYSSDSPGLYGVMADAENILITDEYNGQIIKNNEAIGSKNPWDLLFRFTSPVDIQPGPEGHYYILDGTSHYDFSTHVGNRSMDLYGTSQKEGINARFNTGGVKTDNIRSQGVIAKLNSENWDRWIGDEAGPGVAHCPEEGNMAQNLSDARCSRWTGLGANVNCDDINNAPISECVGQWDWEIHWPYCIRYVPAYDVVEVCEQEQYCNHNTNTCVQRGYCGSDGYQGINVPVPPTPNVTYTPCCINSGNFTPDGSHSGDYVCGCAQMHYECFSYCQAEELGCHEGFAVAHEFLETGPPAWAPGANGGAGAGGGGGGGGSSAQGHCSTAVVRDPINGDTCNQSLDHCCQNLCQRCADDIRRIGRSWHGRLNGCVRGNDCRAGN